MSSNLKWKIINPGEGKKLSCGLKFYIQEKYGCDRTILDCADAPFLEGIGMATQNEEIKRECCMLVDAIMKSPCGIEIWFEY